VPGGEPANDKEINKQIEIASHGFPIDREASGQTRSIQNLRLIMRKHSPETTKRLGGYTRSELRDIALQVSPYEIAPPLQTQIVRFSEKAARKAAPDPQCVRGCGASLKDIDTCSRRRSSPPAQSRCVSRRCDSCTSGR
jgi:hypothetical protein